MKINIALDYDNTYTRDPELWNNFITILKQKGHKVYCVTMRYDVLNENESVNKDLKDKVDDIYFTGRRAKQSFMYKQGISIDVWIDDSPFWIISDAADAVNNVSS